MMLEELRPGQRVRHRLQRSLVGTAGRIDVNRPGWVWVRFDGARNETAIDATLLEPENA